MYHQAGAKGKGKKKGTKKAASGKAKTTVIDGVPLVSMTRDQLEGLVTRYVNHGSLELLSN